MKLALFITLFAAGSLFAAEQKLCPIMVEDEIDVEEVVEYRGTKIYMCCGSCVKTWKKNPDYYAKAAITIDPKLLPQVKREDLKDVKLMPQRFCVIRNDTLVSPDSPSITYKGKKIYFFKERDIERRWKPDPEAIFKKARAAGLLPQFDD